MAGSDINDVRKWDQFCSRLLEKTSAETLEWKDWSNSMRRDDSISPLFVAKYKDWVILIYRYSYNYYHDEERFTPTEEVAIELIDEHGQHQWTLPKVPTRYKLLDLVQYQNSNAASLLDAMLAEDDDE